LRRFHFCLPTPSGEAGGLLSQALVNALVFLREGCDTRRSHSDWRALPDLRWLRRDGVALGGNRLSHRSWNQLVPPDGIRHRIRRDADCSRPPEAGTRCPDNTRMRDHRHHVGMPAPRQHFVSLPPVIHAQRTGGEVPEGRRRPVQPWAGGQGLRDGDKRG